MFNIKKKIYVVHEDEKIDMMYERYIVLHSRFKSMTKFEGAEDDISIKGVVFNYNNIDEMLKVRFDDNVKNFHDVLNKEENLLIIANTNDYARLYMEMQMELKQDFGISEEKLKYMRDTQRMKDFFLGSLSMRNFCLALKPNDSAFERVCDKVKTSYIPTTKLFRSLPELPFEIIYAMYKWGNISKTQANVKIAEIAGPLLLGQIHNTVEQCKIILPVVPEIMQEFMDDDSITSVDDIIKTIYDDNLLTRLFCHSYAGFGNINLDDNAEMDLIKKLCSIIILNDMDFDSQPEIDQQEIDFFFELYEKKDIDVIDNAKFNFISTGMVASRQQKFNVGLIMTK